LQELLFIEGLGSGLNEDYISAL